MIPDNYKVVDNYVSRFSNTFTVAAAAYIGTAFDSINPANVRGGIDIVWFDKIMFSATMWYPGTTGAIPPLDIQLTLQIYGAPDWGVNRTSLVTTGGLVSEDKYMTWIFTPAAQPHMLEANFGWYARQVNLVFNLAARLVNVAPAGGASITYNIQAYGKFLKSM